MRPQLCKPPSTQARFLLYVAFRSEEHTSELQSQSNLVCRLLLEKKKKKVTTDVLHQLHEGVRLLGKGNDRAGRAKLPEDHHRLEHAATHQARAGTRSRRCRCPPPR